ncbi:MAG: DMT family transporter, partial [Alphaproteobacteria bacterium]|nr:DMT family transporter [Alphaproteobacteria bacterium]
GFAGVLIIVRPGGDSFQPASLLPMASSATWALGMIITRKMGLADQPLTTLLYTTLIGLVATGVPALLVWQPIALTTALLMVVGGVLNLVAQYFQVRAFSLGPASLLAPFSYSSIVISTAIGVLWFGTFPDNWTWVGTAIVIASGLYVWHRERVRARERVVMLVEETRRVG